MRIAAIYIEDHEYLFDKPQTINFGGEYFYKFKREKDNDEIIVSREKNENFIEGLFQLTDTESQITQLNAVVGQNGAGKTSILDVIRGAFIGNEYALPSVDSLIIIEDEEIDEPIVLKNEFAKIKLEADEYLTELKNATDLSIQSIYYSPHFNYSFNPNHDNYDQYDLSFDRMVEKDLAQLNEKDSNSSGWPYPPNQELFFKNSLRQIEFLSSELVSTKEIFKELFHLPEHQDPILFFRGYKKEEGVRNIPYELRNILEKISVKIDDELDEWPDVKIKSKKNLDLLSAKYHLKRYLIRQIISLISTQAEKKGDYLSKGYFDIEKHENQIENLSAYESLLFLLENFSIKFSNSEEKVFNVESLKKLLQILYDEIDSVEEEESISQDYLKVSQDKALQILELQRDFIGHLTRYHYLFYPEDQEIIIDEADKIDGFINYMPFTKRLSTGEHALLNLFSRLYIFLNENLKEIKSDSLKKHYILLLDEADLSFHPTWKKKYVKSLLSTLPYFFDELENKPSIQIIFTTHDPITLSDLPNDNVVYLERRSYDEESQILEYEHERRPDKTFGANIVELLSDSFFINESLTGEFATDLIKKTIDWLNEKEEKTNSEYYKRVIGLIDEPIVKRKLAEMYDDKMGTNKEREFIEAEIKRLEALKEKFDR